MLKEKKLSFVADDVKALLQQAASGGAYPRVGDDYSVYEEINEFIRAARLFKLPVTVTIDEAGEVVLKAGA